LACSLCERDVGRGGATTKGTDDVRWEPDHLSRRLGVSRHYVMLAYDIIYVNLLTAKAKGFYC
jgi:hypothetical protein